VKLVTKTEMCKLHYHGFRAVEQEEIVNTNIHSLPLQKFHHHPTSQNNNDHDQYAGEEQDDLRFPASMAENEE
jgi:hypothetical protein